MFLVLFAWIFLAQKPGIGFVDLALGVLYEKKKKKIKIIFFFGIWVLLQLNPTGLADVIHKYIVYFCRSDSSTRL